MGVSYLLGESQHPVLLGRYTARRLLAGLGVLAAGAGLLLAVRAVAAKGSRLFRGRTAVRVDLRSVVPLLGLAFVILAAHAFVNLKRTDDYGSDNYAFWAHRESVTARLAARHAEGGIIEMDDGIISYSMPAPTMSGFGLALDKEAYRAWQRGTLLDVAYARGYRLLGSVWYMQHWPDEIFSDPAALQRHMASLLWGQDLKGWTFTLVDAERGGDFHYAFIRFAPTP